jgi:hypothetical protein
MPAGNPFPIPWQLFIQPAIAVKQSLSFPALNTRRVLTFLLHVQLFSAAAAEATTASYSAACLAPPATIPVAPGQPAPAAPDPPATSLAAAAVAGAFVFENDPVPRYSLSLFYYSVRLKLLDAADDRVDFKPQLSSYLYRLVLMPSIMDALPFTSPQPA